MNALAVNNVAKSVKDENLFSHVSFGLDEGGKIGIIGKNGCGKSTFLKVVAGQLEPDEGEVTVNRSLRMGLLTQNESFPPECTLGDFLYLSDDPLVSMLAKVRAGDSSLNEKAEQLGLWDIETRYRRFLSELGTGASLDSLLCTMSGGMLKKAHIARTLAPKPQILLLDEPTNHLDIPAVEWLESYLADNNCTVMLVTHDRYFLDRVCSRIMEFDKREAFFYEGGYTSFLTHRQERIDALRKEQDRLANVLRRELEWLARGPQARTGKDSGRKKRIEEMKGQVTHEEEESRSFSSIQRRMGKKILELKGVCVSRGEKKILENFDFEFVKGQRIGVVGPNGSGKSTLLEVLTSGIKPDSGIVDTGLNTVFGYYDQTSVNLPLKKTPLEFFSDMSERIVLSSDYEVTPARFLELFGFPSSFHRLPIEVLSGGERRRLYLLSKLVRNPNFLVFDEPTNDLDIDTLRRLEQYILDFNGCAVIVSHDRAFLDRTCTELITLPGAARYEGTYSQWHADQLATQAAQRKDSAREESKQERKRDQKKGLSFKEKQELDSMESVIEALENEKAGLEAFFSSGELDIDGSKQKRYAQLLDDIEQKYSRWEELTCLDRQ